MVIDHFYAHNRSGKVYVYKLVKFTSEDCRISVDGQSIFTGTEVECRERFKSIKQELGIYG